MSLYALDTDCLTLLLHGQAEVSKEAAAHDPAELALTIITVEETLTRSYSQIRRAKKDDQLIRAYAALQQAVEFFGRVRIPPMNPDAVERFHELRRACLRFGKNDIRIARAVPMHDATPVTRNVGIFQGSPGLKVEN